MADTPRTIVMLSEKRCGSTAMFRVFQKHPGVGVCHVDPGVKNSEPNFWNLAADAVAGSPEAFARRMADEHPDVPLPKAYTPEAVFAVWDDVLAKRGPVVFDKSPQYLASDGAFELLGGYMRRGHDVRIFAVIRDPRDSIVSAYEHWRRQIPGDSPEAREARWLEKYGRLERLRGRGFADIPLFRYEDFAAAPGCYGPMLMKHCGLPYNPECFAHFREVSLGRYSASILPEVRRWRFSEAFREHLGRYGYPTPQLPWSRRLAVTTRMLSENVARETRFTRLGKLLPAGRRAA